MTKAEWKKKVKRYDSLWEYKRNAIGVACDFRYPTETLEAIISAETEREISDALALARRSA